MNKYFKPIPIIDEEEAQAEARLYWLSIVPVIVMFLIVVGMSAWSIVHRFDSFEAWWRAACS